MFNSFYLPISSFTGDTSNKICVIEQKRSPTYKYILSPLKSLVKTCVH